MKNTSASGEHEPSKNTQPAQTGNASNPSPQANENPPVDEQLLSGNAEKYLREVASIEDVPDPQDQEEMDQKIEEEKRRNE